MKRACLFLVLLTLAVLPLHSVQAQQSTPYCTFQPDGSIFCTIGDGGDDGTCIPGKHLDYVVLSYYDAQPGTGQMIEPAADDMEEVPCQAQPTPPKHPWDTFIVEAGGITCGALEWNVQAQVAFPPIYLDVRPYPATLVRWPTAIRNGGLPTSSGSGGVAYIPYGGGSPSSPRVGDWQDLTLTLTLRPAGMMFVSLPHVGNLILPDQGSTGSPMLIQWEVPSHPAAGGGPLAGNISGLDELPADLPLFVGQGHAPYRLFWDLRYYRYEAIKECAPGADENGNYTCDEETGHWEVVGYEWRQHGRGGEIPPAAVQNLPASVMADLNGDGIPDAYWDNNLTLRRMDDNNRVDNPRYRRSWNWGGIIYWAVREGQGQIGWPGQ